MPEGCQLHAEDPMQPVVRCAARVGGEWSVCVERQQQQQQQQQQQESFPMVVGWGCLGLL
jgi:hypothetical protein